MSSMDRKLHIVFFPLMAYGHTIPTVDMAKLFASRGLKATIITTPGNAPHCSKTIQRTKDMGFDIDVYIFNFPSADAGLPEGFESLDSIISCENVQLLHKFFVATAMLQEPLEKLLQEYNPDCLIADMFFPWATNVAAKFGIPRLVFHGTSFFSSCTAESIRLYLQDSESYTKVSSDSEPFVVPNLPGEINLTRNQLPDFWRLGVETDFSKFLTECKESELKSFGVIVNTFYELEPAYAEHYSRFWGRRAWHIGPVSLCNRRVEDKAGRGQEASINEHECLKWLDSKKPNSVVYLCFGSLNNFSPSQLKEIAFALEASGQQFVWVVKKQKNKQEDQEEWLPEGFEKRTEGKGLIIRGWAPQVLILDHEAVGGFLTHCGWNSTLEGITAGKPMATRPVNAEQFYNEKLVTEVLRIGVEVGVKQWDKWNGDHVKSENIEKAITRIMVGEEADKMRSRARKLAEMARKAVEEGGSSDSHFNDLIQELRKRT